MTVANEAVQLITDKEGDKALNKTEQILHEPADDAKGAEESAKENVPGNITPTQFPTAKVDLGESAKENAPDNVTATQISTPLPPGPVGLTIRGDPGKFPMVTSVSDGSALSCDSVGMVVVSLLLPDNIAVSGKVGATKLCRLLRQHAEKEGRIVVLEKVPPTNRQSFKPRNFVTKTLYPVVLW